MNKLNNVNKLNFDIKILQKIMKILKTTLNKIPL